MVLHSFVANLEHCARFVLECRIENDEARFTSWRVAVYRAKNSTAKESQGERAGRNRGEDGTLSPSFDA